jgi:cytochrome c
MTKNFLFTNFFMIFDLPDHPRASSQKQRRSRVFLVHIALVLLVLGMEGVAGSAIASPEAKTLLEDKACGGCHIIPGVNEAWGKAGPSLKGFSKRKRIIRNSVKNNEENLRSWLRDPNVLKPGTLMPNLGLTDEEVEILIRYFNKI